MHRITRLRRCSRLRLRKNEFRFVTTDQNEYIVTTRICWKCACEDSEISFDIFKPKCFEVQPSRRLFARRSAAYGCSRERDFVCSQFLLVPALGSARHVDVRWLPHVGGGIC